MLGCMRDMLDKIGSCLSCLRIYFIASVHKVKSAEANRGCAAGIGGYNHTIGPRVDDPASRKRLVLLSLSLSFPFLDVPSRCFYSARPIEGRICSTSHDR